MFACAASRSTVSGLQIDRGPARDVVEADRHGRRVGDGDEVAVQPLGCGLVVVRCGDEQPVDAQAAHPAGLLDRLAGVVVGGSRHDRHPARGGLDDRRDHRSRSSADRVCASPVLPQGTRKSMPSSICHSTSSAERLGCPPRRPR